MVSIFAVFGLEETRGRFDETVERTKKWTQLAPEMHAFLLAEQREFLRTNGQSQGTQIPGYGSEPEYEAAKFAKTGDTTPLRWKGGEERLYPSLVDQGHPEHKYEVTSAAIEFGTSVPYAERIQQGGTNQFGEPAPPRQVVVTGAPLRERIGELMLAFIVDGTRDGADWGR